MRDLLDTKSHFAAKQQHIWWGVSVENQKHGLPRIEHLRQSSALLRLLSIEPLLEAQGTINLEGINRIIAGGESGPKASSMDLDWVRQIRRQCEEAQVPLSKATWRKKRQTRP
jgi:protein gp37